MDQRLQPTSQAARADPFDYLLTPYRSPWLIPLESIFGWIKHQILGDRLFDAPTELQAAVGRCFRRRVAQAEERRDKAWAMATQNPRCLCERALEIYEGTSEIQRLIISGHLLK